MFFACLGVFRFSVLLLVSGVDAISVLFVGAPALSEGPGLAGKLWFSTLLVRWIETFEKLS